MLSGFIGFIYKYPRLKAKVRNKLKKYPRLQAHLRRFAIARGILVEPANVMPATEPNSQDVHVAQSLLKTDEPYLSPHARRIYQDLQTAIAQQQKEHH